MLRFPLRPTYTFFYALGGLGLALACLIGRPVNGVAAAGLQKPAAAAAAAAPLDFDRDVRPILSENCFSCHGFDGNTRQAGLRLDTEAGAMQKLPSGSRAVVSGKPGASALIQRVVARGALQMPPPASEKKLTARQVAVLRQWIAQGGKYRTHWALRPAARPPLPPVRNAAWARNPIDRFILARLEKEKLAPSPEADRATLLRRVTLDLTGLPPTPAERDAFLADRRPDAYERLVDRLLASPYYGERMALPWLDLARYADTHGYHIDSHRDMWRWRDWVIAAFNRNLPYDQFTVQQIAGDLLPGAGMEEKIATGFNRNHPINFEGGAIPEEYAAAYVFDRVDTTATVFMGLTATCARCHDHKFDPITQKDYYRLFAYFNNVPENGLDGQKGNAAPFLKAPLPGQQAELDGFGKKIAGVEQAMKARAIEAVGAQADWEKTALMTAKNSAPALAAGLAAHYGFDEANAVGAVSLPAPLRLQAPVVHGKAVQAAGKVGSALSLDGAAYLEIGDALALDRDDAFSYGAWVQPTGKEGMAVISRMDDARAIRGWDMYLGDGRAFIHLIHRWDTNVIRVNTKETPIEPGKWTHVFMTYDGSGKAKGVSLYVNGKKAAVEITHDSLTGTIHTPKPAIIGRRNPSAPFKGLMDEVRVYNRALSAAEVEQLVAWETLSPLLAAAADRRTAEQKSALSRYYLENHDGPYRQLVADLAGWKKKHADLDAAIPTSMVMQEMAKPRETRILARGMYDKKGEVVTPGVPASLPPLPKNAPPNRLGLARWLVDPAHPLTARVAVNRFWQMYFGTGIVPTSENFGTQGEQPSHPELLDWLATEFVRTRWDIKAMQRLIVTSATYRQAARVTPALRRRDPENRLLARSPRIRLTAEAVRDQALVVSGLLVPTVGGPSVRPYQPPGLWEEIAFGGGFTAQTYQQDKGDALYRRSLYTFWKRTVPPPSLQTFDAPEREFCLVRRSVTNTPLQALILMNDPTYVEASRKLAERIVVEGGATAANRLAFAYRLVVGRSPKPAESRVLLEMLQQQRAAFGKDAALAGKLLKVGESPRREALPAAEVAAWTTIAGILLNLDETITKG